ncbi:MAG: hypothetical protein COZ85_00600 [Candidatus Moranbacteria bacterium CG_4_8_14_3_um_filter_34_16]|nr:MAG: hypothetical protein COZ85_00600 [Candidatus Moranbacteria bacterium CG_4_8_14_3_um_filter_34_16]
MRQIALFLRFYQGYTMTDVLDEYAIRFFYLLDDMYKIKAEEQEAISMASAYPYMKKEDARTYMSNLSRAKRDIIDIGRNNDNYDGLTALKKSLGTKKEK